MDPTTTLFTFLLQTDPSVQSVQLIGSWDNFSTCYSMERDSRRGRDQWRGCFSFKDIVCDDDNSSRNDTKRSGGLKMGHTYYYYYEVDGSTEMHDPTMPSTTTCPYLPGQAVNTLNVPHERSLRYRSASMNSMRQENFKTMDPAAKFTNPKPVTPQAGVIPRHAESASILRHYASARSLSPTPSWKRFFSRKIQSIESERGRSLDRDDRSEDCFTSYDNVISFPAPDVTHSRPSTRAESSRTRAISPDSLRRMLCEDGPVSRPQSTTTERPTVTIPNDAVVEDVDEDEDDDDNFATSAVSESLSYATSLSPPPFKRSSSSESIPHSVSVSNTRPPVLRAAKSLNHVSSQQMKAHSASSRRHGISIETSPESSPEIISPSRWSISVATKPLPPPPEAVPMSFDDDDEDDVLSSNEDDTIAYLPLLPTSTFTQHSFKGYSLPTHIEDVKEEMGNDQTFTNFSSPKMIHGGDSSNGSNLLGTHNDSGLDDFVSELGWIVDAIGTNGH